MSTVLTDRREGLRHSQTPSPFVARVERDAAVVHVIDPEGGEHYHAAIRRSPASRVVMYRSPDEFLRTAETDSPGCLVVRFRDSGQGVGVLQHEMTRCGIELPMIVTTDDADFRVVSQLMENGAMAVLAHPTPADQLGQYVDAAIEHDRTRHELRQQYQELSGTLRRLTARQRKILELANDGLPNKGIAAALDVSVRTVEVDRSKILRTFNTRALSNVTRRLGELKMLSLWNSNWRLARPRLRIVPHM